MPTKGRYGFELRCPKSDLGQSAALYEKVLAKKVEAAIEEELK